MSQTDENLKAAFAGESQANRKYLAFSKKADADKLPGIARLFRAAAAAETIHAHNHLDVMGSVKTTKENLEAAAAGEAAEFEEMYPEFLEQAEKDGDNGARESFDYANQVEKIHHGLYQEAGRTLAEGSDLPENEMNVCPVCGNTFAGEAPERCPICRTPKSRFILIG
ncbi:MAG: rubrerythrin family protein [Candidatus Brocadiia bacterium]|jgi:rubrerythrin|nr:rubrerythrin family protein [Candidatus Brocadiia bacterium]